jgi:hypothetical protein
VRRRPRRRRRFADAPALLLWAVPYITSLEGFQVAASHFVERHGLVVIVALGESIVVLGVGAGRAEVGFELALIALLGLALSASLWWTYFSHEILVASRRRFPTRSEVSAGRRHSRSPPEPPSSSPPTRR